MGKAEGDRTTAPQQGAAFNDPRWLPMQSAIELRQKQTGATWLAILDLERVMAAGDLPSMRRHGEHGELCQQLNGPFWVDHLFDYTSGIVTIYRRTVGEPRKWNLFAYPPDQRVDGLYFVWQPDFERLYGGAAQAETKPAERKQPLGWQMRRVVPLLTELYVSKGISPDSLQLETVFSEVNEVLAKRKERPVSRDSVRRGITRLLEQNEP
jgi:hypothetical protein